MLYKDLTLLPPPVLFLPSLLFQATNNSRFYSVSSLSWHHTTHTRLLIESPAECILPLRGLTVIHRVILTWVSGVLPTHQDRDVIPSLWSPRHGFIQLAHPGGFDWITWLRHVVTWPRPQMEGVVKFGLAAGGKKMQMHDIMTLTCSVWYRITMGLFMNVLELIECRSYASN